MSKLSDFASGEIVEFAATVLRGSEFGREDGSVNLNAAAAELCRRYERLRESERRAGRLGKATPLAGRRTPDAARKLFERVVRGDCGRLGQDQGRYLLNLVSALGADTRSEAHALWTRINGFREWEDEWFGPASGDEVVALRLPTWDLDQLVVWHVKRHGGDDGPNLRRWLRNDRLIARRLLGDNDPNAGPLPQPTLDALDSLEFDARDAGRPPREAQLAIRRILGPLCVWYRSGGACLGWHQLTARRRENLITRAVAAGGCTACTACTALLSIACLFFVSTRA